MISDNEYKMYTWGKQNYKTQRSNGNIRMKIYENFQN